MVIALPASHPLARHRSLPLAMLADEPFILFPRLVGLSLYDDVVLACRKAGFELTVAQEAPQISSVVNLVAADLGVSIVPSLDFADQARRCGLPADRGAAYRGAPGTGNVENTSLAGQREPDEPAELKRVAIFQIRSSRFRSLFLPMSFSQNRCTLLRDML